MALVLLQVKDIIGQVDRARKKAKEGERGSCLEPTVGLEKIHGKDKRGKDEQVLGPLRRPQRLEEIADRQSQPFNNSAEL
jgi:hypothetical protein